MEVKKRRYSHEKDLVSSKPEIKAFLLIGLIVFVILGGLIFKFAFLNSSIESNNKIIAQIPSMKEQISNFQIQKPILERKLATLKTQMKARVDNAIGSKFSKLHLTQYLGLLESLGIKCSSVKVEEPKDFIYGAVSIPELAQTVVQYQCHGDYASYLKAQSSIDILGDNVNLINQKIVKLSDGVNISGVLVYTERK